MPQGITTDNNKITKSFADTFLYGMANNEYEKRLFNFIMTGTAINVLAPDFEDVMYEVKKRQTTSVLVKVLQSKNVILLSHPNPLPKAFKVFAAKDVKTNDGKLKVFIDADVLRYVDGKWVCSNVDILVAHLVNAMNTLIYYADPKRIIMRDEIIKSGSSAFATMFTHIIDYLYKITTVANTRDKCLYLATIYYNKNILCKDITDSIKAVARNISGLSEREEDILWIQINDDKDFLNIKFFIEAIARILKLSKLTLDVFIEKYIYIYGTGVQFSLELFPSFASMITNAYTGCYLNNQKTIEKLVGSDMIKFSTAVLKVGAESV
jgi:hypothetical protein